jgi:hypothetical protein
MIDISRLREAVEICKEVELDDKDIVQVFTVYNHLEYIDTSLSTRFDIYYPFDPKYFDGVSSDRKELIGKLKHDLHISSTQTNTNQ